MNDGRRLLGLLLTVVLFATGQGCGSAPMEGELQPDEDEIVDDPGTLELDVTGLPPGTDADVIVTSPDGRERSFAVGAALERLEPGDYVVTAAAVLGSDGFGYRPGAASQTIFVEAGATSDAIVAYEASSGSLLVAVNGLSHAAEADVTVTGPNGFSVDLLEQSTVLTDLVPGSYTVEMRDVTSDDADFVAEAPLTQSVFVNEGFAATINMGYLCVRVDIWDDGVEAALRELTGKTAGDLDCEDLAAVVNLNLGYGVEALFGLQHLRNLERLSVSQNDAENGVSHLEPLRHLTTLVELDLSENNLSDLEPLTGLENLEVLHIGGNLAPLEDLSPLQSLRSLRELYLDDGGLTAEAIEPLGELTQLEVLHLENNPLGDVSGLAPLVNLKKLDIEACEVTDIGPLAEMTDLAQLSIGKNPISDLSPLASVTNLVRLDVAYTGIPSLDDVASFGSLVELNASGNELWELDPLSKLQNLKKLILIDNVIEDLESLKANGALEVLALVGNKVSDLAPLKALGRLNYLYLDLNFIQDLTPLVDGAFLEELIFVSLECNNLDLRPESETAAQIAKMEDAGPQVGEGLQRPHPGCG